MSTGQTPKDVVWLHGEIKTPPFTRDARIEAGTLLRRLQEGEDLALPHSRPMPDIGPRCHELRIRDKNRIWRIVYRTDPEEIIIAEVFAKTTKTTPRHVIDDSQRRLRLYDDAAKRAKKGGRER